MQRHAARLDDGLKVVQETRHFHEDSGITTSGRSKETAEDYRYFPEPDLVPIAPDPAWVEELRATLPERPSVVRARLQKEWNIADKEMASMVNAGVLDVVIETVALGADSTKARSWWVGEIARQANERGVEVIDVGITATDVARIVELVATGELTDKLARQVVDGVIAGEGRPDDVVAKRGLKVVSDDGALLAAIAKAIESESGAAEKVRSGNLNAAGALIGLVMKETKGQADAAKVRELLLKELGQ